MPADLTFATTRSQLAQDHLTIRGLGGPGNDGFTFAPHAYGANTQSYVTLWSGEMGQLDVPTPANIDVFFSPGYRWESIDFASSDDVYGQQPLLAGRTYRQTFDAAVFSPSPSFGPQVFGSVLNTTEAFGNDLFVDAANQGGESVGLAQTTWDPQGWLYQGSKLIAHVSGYNANFSAKIPATLQTYTMKVSETRPVPYFGIAKSITATYTFEAKAGDTSLVSANFWPRMLPQGVSETNTAAGGAKTDVPITFSTVNGIVAVHDVAVWASSNGGRTWTALRVTRGGDGWSVVVSDPRQAGFVSLRVQGEDAAGFKTVVTAIDAYAVS